MAVAASDTGGPLALDPDPARDEVWQALQEADPSGSRAAAVFRNTFDQLYDGQHTGRFRWDQLYKTEKTHYGTLLEINLRREFTDVIADGVTLDYHVSGHDVDCKYSQSMGGWMLPPESFDKLLLVATAEDGAGTWSLGVVRASEPNRRSSVNRDGKSQLNSRGRQQIAWLHLNAELPPNVLLSLSEEVLQQILRPRSGQGRVIELLRRVTARRIGRNTIATVAQQSDYMKRVRWNGGARTLLQREGYLVIGHYRTHQAVALQLGVEVPQAGEIVSVRVVPAAPSDTLVVELDGRLWRVAREDEPSACPAPRLPTTHRFSSKPDVTWPTRYD